MLRRKYTHIKQGETQIIAMYETGMTQRSVADELSQILNKLES